MAQQVSVSFVDDIDGSEADGTVEFGLDGRSYEIDLSTDNAKKLRDALALFVASGRRTGGGPGRKPAVRSGAKPSTDKGQNQAIREWAKGQGFKVSERGRIPAEVLLAYKQRNEPQEAAPAAVETPEEVSPVVELDTSDDAVLAWHKAKGYKIPEGGKVNGLMRSRYTRAHSW